MTCDFCPEIKGSLKNIEYTIIKIEKNQQDLWKYLEDRTNRIQNNSVKINYIFGIGTGIGLVIVGVLIKFFTYSH